MIIQWRMPSARRKSRTFANFYSPYCLSVAEFTVTGDTGDSWG
jgi:hypothetical protein